MLVDRPRSTATQCNPPDGAEPDQPSASLSGGLRRFVLLTGLLATGSTLIVACGQTPQPAPVLSAGHDTLPAGVFALATNDPAAKVTYRVPAMAVTNNGTIVVTLDARHHTGADLPNDIDIVERRSTDGGATWSQQAIAVGHTGGSTAATADGVGDSSLLCDHVTGRLFMFYEYAPARVSIFTSSTSRAPHSDTTVHAMLRYSDDNGLTWSQPIDLTPDLKRPGVGGIFATSGHGIQTANGTLMQPYSYFIEHVQHAAIAYSTDHGATWKLTGPIGEHLSENKLVQLDTGALLDDARPTAPGFRMFSHATCITCQWSVPAEQTSIPDPMANGDLIRVTGHASWLLETNLDSQHARVRLTVRLSTDDGAHWTHSWVVETGPAGYSVMAALPGGDYGLVYESVSGVAYERFTLCQLEPCGIA